MAKTIGLALWLALVGSSSDAPSGGAAGEFPCDNLMSKCPNDPPFDAATCRRITTDPKCGAVSRTLFRCIGDHQVCGADGKTDQNVTNQACAAEFGASLQCAASYNDAAID